MALPTLRSVSSTSTTATSVSVSAPAGVAEHDLLLAKVNANTAGKTAAIADGTSWSLIRSVNNNGSTDSLWWRRATASEPGTYAFKHSDDSSDTFTLAVMAWDGVSRSNPFDNFASGGTTVGNTTSSIASYDTTVDDCVALATLSIIGNLTVATPPSGFTLAVEEDGIADGQSNYYKDMATAGAVGAIQWVLSASGTHKSYSLALRPEGGSFEGPEFPASAANVDNAGGNAWSNPTNALTSNDSRATATVNGTAQTDYLDLTNFDFSALPGGATIDGIEVNIEKQRTGGTTGEVRDAVVQLIVSGTPTGDNKALTAVDWLTAEANTGNGNPPPQSLIYGSPLDDWSAGHTVSSLQDSTSGVRIAVAGAAGGANRVANIDAIWIHVYYTAAAAGGTVGEGLTRSVLLQRRRLAA